MIFVLIAGIGCIEGLGWTSVELPMPPERHVDDWMVRQRYEKLFMNYI